jgi:DeoR family transcriptional regulator of aga operon
VSEVTIRSDLDVLAEEGHIQRVRGGAIHRATASLEASFEQDQDTSADEKRSIAAAAAELVESGQTILMDAGSTAAALARALVARTDLHDVTVFTNGLRVALELEAALPQFTVLLTGGTLRRQQHSLVNPMGMTIWEQIHGHIAFLGCHGIDAQAGVTHISVAEAEIKRAILNSARTRVVVAEGGKVGQVSLVHLFAVSDVDLLVTGPSADNAAVSALRERGLDIHIVS